MYSVKSIRVSAKSGNSGENQGNGLCLKGIRGKLGNLTNSRESQGMSEKMLIFVSSINRFTNTLKNSQENTFLSSSVIN